MGARENQPALVGPMITGEQMGRREKRKRRCDGVQLPAVFK
jgi:hypothetical protein